MNFWELARQTSECCQGLSYLIPKMKGIASAPNLNGDNLHFSWRNVPNKLFKYIYFMFMFCLCILGFNSNCISQSKTSQLSLKSHLIIEIIHCIILNFKNSIESQIAMHWIIPSQGENTSIFWDLHWKFCMDINKQFTFWFFSSLSTWTWNLLYRYYNI